MTATFCVRPNGPINSSFCNVSCVGYVCTPCLPICQPFNGHQNNRDLCLPNYVPSNKPSIFILDCDYQRCLPKAAPECIRNIKCKEIKSPPLCSAYKFERCPTNHHCRKFQQRINFCQRKYEHRTGSVSALCRQIKIFKSGICGSENEVFTSHIEEEVLPLDDTEETILSAAVIYNDIDNDNLQCIQYTEDNDVLAPLSRTFPDYHDPTDVDTTENITKTSYTLAVQDQKESNKLEVQNQRESNTLEIQDQKQSNTLGIRDQKQSNTLGIRDQKQSNTLGVQDRRKMRNVTSSTVGSRSTLSSKFSRQERPKRTESKSSKQKPTVAKRRTMRSARQNHDIDVAQNRRYPPIAFNIPHCKGTTGIMIKSVEKLVQPNTCRHPLRRACQGNDYSTGISRHQLNFCKQSQNVPCTKPYAGSQTCGPVYCLSKCIPEVFQIGKCFEICNLNCGIRKEIPHSNGAGRIYMCSRINSRVPQLPTQCKRNWCVDTVGNMFCVGVRR